jgi:hypothetical protein
MNKIAIELDLPLYTDSKCEDILIQQTELLVGVWRDMLARYKVNGVTIPSLAFKRGKAKVEVANPTGLNEFSKALLEHHLQYMPKDNIPAQRKAIKSLYATGKTAEELIAFYEESRRSYALTSWFTVRYKLGKVVEEVVEKEEVTFERQPLDEQAQAELIQRLKQNEVL